MRPAFYFHYGDVRCIGNHRIVLIPSPVNWPTGIILARNQVLLSLFHQGGVSFS